EQTLDLIAVHGPRAEVLGRLRAAGDAVGKALLLAPPLVTRGDVAGDERVARADRGDRLQRLGVDLQQAPLGALTDHRDTALRARDRGLGGAQADDLQQAGGEVR